MTKFNLEQAKSGAPICCRDGSPAKFIAHVPEATTFHAIVYLSGRRISTTSESGQYQFIPTDWDLFMADTPKVKRTGWVKVQKANIAKCVRSEEFTLAGLDPETEIAARIEWEE